MNQPAAKHTSTHSGQWPRAKSSPLSNGALILFQKTSPAARVSAERYSLCYVSLRGCRGYCVRWFYIIKVCTCCFMSVGIVQMSFQDMGWYGWHTKQWPYICYEKRLVMKTLYKPGCLTQLSRWRVSSFSGNSERKLSLNFIWTIFVFQQCSQECI